MTNKSILDLMDELKRMQAPANDLPTATNEQVEAMRNILQLVRKTEENAPSSKEDNILSSIKEFMGTLTIDDCHTFARDVRRILDSIIETRQEGIRRWGKDEIVDDRADAVKIFERMRQQEQAKIDAQRKRALLESQARAQRLKEQEEARIRDAELKEKAHAEFIADEMEKAAMSAKRSFEVPAGDGSDEMISYTIDESKGERKIEIAPTELPSQLSGYKVADEEVTCDVPDISISKVVPVAVDPSSNIERPEDAFPGYLSLDEAIDKLKKQKKTIVAILQEPAVLDNPAAFSSFTQQLSDIADKLGLMKRERTNRLFADKKKEG